MMKNFILLAVISFASLRALAQVEPIVFEEKEYDFGIVNEADGPVTHEFVFLNNTDGPVKILNVRASCGCTTPGWSKEEVQPGKSGFVKAQYNPYNRPGPFNKTLTVSTTLNKNIILRIKGSVKPRVKTLEEQFPTLIGNLRFRSSSFNVGKVTPHAPVTREFEVINVGEQTIKFLNNSISPNYIHITFLMPEIAPKERGKIEITYDASKKNDLGFLIDNIAINTTDSLAPRKEFKVYATVDPYIPPMTREERMQAPHLKMGSNIIDFGTIKTGQKVEKEYVLENTGKSKLDIIKVKPSCNCIIPTTAQNSIEPNQSVKLKIVFDATGMRGTQQKYITIFSNDPSGPARKVILKAVVSQ